MQKELPEWQDCLYNLKNIYLQIHCQVFETIIVYVQDPLTFFPYFVSEAGTKYLQS